MREIMLKILAAVEALAPAAGAGDSKDPVVKETKEETVTEEPVEEPVPETTRKRSVSK